MNNLGAQASLIFARQVRNGLADIDVIVGYNWINDDCYHFGTYLQAVLPTGKKRKNLFIFSPVVGNGKHFELGCRYFCTYGSLERRRFQLSVLS